MLGRDPARLLKCVPKKVAMLTLEQVPCTALRQRANTPLTSLAVDLGLGALALSPQQDLE
jgi:hypothetical protein